VRKCSTECRKAIKALKVADVSLSYPSSLNDHDYDDLLWAMCSGRTLQSKGPVSGLWRDNIELSRPAASDQRTAHDRLFNCPSQDGHSRGRLQRLVMPTCSYMKPIEDIQEESFRMNERILLKATFRISSVSMSTS